MTETAHPGRTKAARYAHHAMIELRAALANAEANKLETGPAFSGSHNCLDNIVRDYDRRNGGHWFDRDSMRFFRTRFPSGFLDVPAARVTLFVTTESPPDGGRKASIRAYLWDTACVCTPGPFCEHSIAVAEKARDLLADALAFPRVAHQGRRTYWEIAAGLYQTTVSVDVLPNMNGAGYPDLAALCRLKGDTPPAA